MRYVASIAYDGTEYCGWQRQPVETPSIQGLIETALTLLDKGSPVAVTASGRTDAGVHAVDQRAHFDLSRGWDPQNLLKAVNANLPEAIRLQWVREASENFHARRDAVQKQYAYYVQTGVTWLPHLDRFSHWIPTAPDIVVMREAAVKCIGTLDFATFQGSKAANLTTIRELLEFEISEDRSAFLGADVSVLRFRLVGRGFLKQMVRSLVGTVLEVGLGRRSLDTIDALFSAPSRQSVGETLPAKGLFLEKVWYKTDLLCNTP